MNEQKKGTSMAKTHPLLIAIMLLVCAGLSACGTTGTTSRFVLDSKQNAPLLAEVRISSAAMDPGASRHLAVGKVRPWGKFDAEDLRNLEESLRDSVAAAVPATFQPSAPRLDVHVVVRSYLVAVSNTGGGVFATIAWAASNAQGEPVFQEEFYASDSVHFIGTVGGLKDDVHRAIVRRIAVTTLALASGPAAAAARPTTFEKTSTSFEEAAARVPKTMVTMGNAFLMSSGNNTLLVVGALLPQKVASNIQWATAKQSQDFDWQGYLEKLYTNRSVPQSVTGPSSPVAAANLGAQTALAAPTRTADSRPAEALPTAGASWQYAYTMRGIGSARFTFGVRVSGVEDGIVHEIITIPSSPERRVSVSADSLSFRSFQLPQSQTLVELAPYLHSVLAKNEPRVWGNLAGYPVGNPTLAPWTITVREGGQQDVTVPAGTFRATRIEISGRRSGVSLGPLARESGRFQLRAWYAPQVRRYVRLQHEVWSAAGDTFGVQLVELTGYSAK